MARRSTAQCRPTDGLVIRYLVYVVSVDLWSKLGLQYKKRIRCILENSVENIFILYFKDLKLINFLKKH